jgi:hypothetical protein
MRPYGACMWAAIGAYKDKMSGYCVCAAYICAAIVVALTVLHEQTGTYLAHSLELEDEPSVMQHHVVNSLRAGACSHLTMCCVLHCSVLHPLHRCWT